MIDLLNIVAPPDWMLDAACAEVDAELFFPVKGESIRPAVRVCAGCGVRAECLAYALTHRIEYGVWGGVGAAARRRILTHTERTARLVDRDTCGQKPRAERVRRLVAAGRTDSEIAEVLGCSVRTVGRIRKAAAIPAAQPCIRRRVGVA